MSTGGKTVKSLWRETQKIAERETLPENLKVDTVVIGAGMAGILTAYFLQKQGREVVIVEAKEIASGQTERTTAKITSQHGLIYEKLIRKVGRKRALSYARANEEAIDAFAKIIRDEQIACDFERLPAILYTQEKEGREVLKKEAAAAGELGIAAQFLEGNQVTELPFSVEGAVEFENQAQFHPLKFISHLAVGLTIYENTKVLEVKKHMVCTSMGDIEAENIVFATHYPFVNVPGFYFLRQHQERSYVLALEGQEALSGMYYGIDKNGLSLRSAGDKLLLGGGAHRTGKKMCERKLCEEQKTGYTFLHDMAQSYYPKTPVAGAWAAQDCMSHDDIPFIGRYSMFRPYWYVATGFKKWGMTSSMVAAKIISDVIIGRENPYGDVFKPGRFYFRAAIKNLLIDIGESVMGLSKGLFSKKERRCPHMGCRLEWNGEEASWDCPCHGSRFTCIGELQDNPAQIDLGEKE